MEPLVKRIRGFFTLFAAVIAVALAGGCGTASEPPVRLPARAVSIGVAPDNPGTLWEATSRTAYRSLDGGDSWRAVPRAPGGGSIAFLAKHALLAAGTGLWTGPSGGTGMVAMHRPPAPFRAISTAFYGVGRVYALDHAGRLWLSVTGGGRWSRVRAAGLPPGGVSVAARRAKTTRPDTVFVAAGSRGLWVSRDFGSHFRRVPGIADATGVATTTHDATRVLVSTPSGLLLSTDDGRSFRDVLRLRGVTAIALDSRNWRNAFAATSGGLLLRSDDGGSHWDLR
ncbi:MAG: WD40/YVTN/BNR-like repeat-containing protein [Gaiellales bacterium]